MGGCTAVAVLACACGVGTGGLNGGGVEDGAATAHDGKGEADATGISPNGDATLALPTLGDATVRDSRTDDSRLEDTGPPDVAGQDCNTACMTQTCGGQQAACGLGSDCEAYLACLIGCGGSDAALCSSDCESTHAAGAQASAALAGCTLICGLECAAGSSDAGPAD